MKPESPRAAVTGFYVGRPRAGESPEAGGWLEWDVSGEDILRSAFAHGRDASPAYRRLREDGYSRGASAVTRAALELQHIGLWDKSGLALDPARVAVSFTSSKGELGLLERMRDESGGMKGAAISSFIPHPASCLGWTCDAAAAWWGRLTSAQGAMLSPVAACATGAHTIAAAAQWIEDGYADVVIAGALEMSLTPLVMAGYRSLGAMSKSGVMRPFDRHRDGFVPAEGMACLVLENEAFANARQAAIHGYVTGWSMHADATSMTGMDPDGDSIARAIEVALRRAGEPVVDYINMHGTATRANDTVETRAVKRVFGRSVPASSTKPLTGHWLGAAGAVEAVICLLAMRENYAPPTLNLREPDEACDLDYVPLHGRGLRINTAMSLNYGFGGHIGVLVLQSS
jgi:3-oxoacyl-[acyl-carrier-protein] synthase II